MALVPSSSRGGDGTSAVSTATVAVTSAQLLALFTTPVALVAAPGVGSALFLVAPPAMQYHAGATPYTDPAAGSELFVGYSGVTVLATNNEWYVNVPGFLDQAAGQVAQAGPDNPLALSQPLVLPFASIANKALLLMLDKFGGGGANLTLGNGTLTVVLQYVTLTA